MQDSGTHTYSSKIFPNQWMGWVVLVGLCLYGCITIEGLTASSSSVRNLILLIIGFKVVSWWGYEHQGNKLITLKDHLLYGFLWVGMNAKEFFRRRPQNEEHQGKELRLAFIEMAIGIFLVYLSHHMLPNKNALVAAWARMLGWTAIIYFSLFRFMAILFQKGGYGARALMNRPFTSKNLAIFWSYRWNRAYNYIMKHYFFGPVKKLWGWKWGLFAAFFVSGLIHEVIISVPIQKHYGLPTLYFLIQAVGVLIQKTQIGRTLQLDQGMLGRVFGLVWVLGPVGILFPPDFMLSVFG